MADPLSKLLPYGIGGLAVLAIVLFLANAYFAELAKGLAGRTPDAVLRLLRRQRRVGGRQLRRYRARAIDRHRRHQLGLIEDDTVDIRQIYVPLRCADTGDELAPTVRAAQRCVVLGAPGAGKSLLLKSAILDWAAEEEDDQGIPVLLDLHRCNSSDASFEEMVAEQFEWGQVQNAATYARNALDGGQLRIFFDGLDEVAPAELEKVVGKLKDFGSRYPDCQMTVTCRAASWTGQLTPDFSRVLRVAEFDDPSVRVFLRRWHALGPASRLTGVEQVLSALRANPELMRLARSPLMLTIIAWLQSETRAEEVGPLPHSRAAFYRLAIEHLLDRDRRLNRGVALGRYHAQRKLIALQRIALTLQETYATRSDRLVIDRAALDRVLTEILPNCNLSEADRDPFFEEIVQRSQLMIAVDSIGNRFSFPHLTLQEFLAAQALHDQPDRLLRNYRADPAGWRETVRMWCAVASVDCTGVVRELWEGGSPEGRELALACLGDAVHVDSGLADGIVERGLEEFRGGGNGTVRFDSALAALAASPTPRGERVREELIAILEPSSSSIDLLQVRAPTALALSGHVDAAEALARCAEERGGDGEPYARMLLLTGEVAIPAVGQAAGPGEQVWAVDLLAELVMDDAMEAVKPLVGALVYDGPSACRAAWRLASLIDDPAVEETIGKLPVPDWPGHNDDSFDWIWEPFAAGPVSPLPRIVGRVVRLMGAEPEADAWLHWSGELPPRPSDAALREAARGIDTVSPRIAIPVIGTDMDRRYQAELHEGALAEVRGDRRRRLRALVRPGHSLSETLLSQHLRGFESVPALRDAVLTVHGGRTLTPHRLLLDRLPEQVQAHVLADFYGDLPGPPVHDPSAWASVNQPPPSDPARFRITAFLLFVVGVVLPVGVPGVWSGLTDPWGPEWWAWVAGPSLALGAVLKVCSYATWFPIGPYVLWDTLDDIAPWLVALPGLAYVSMAGFSALAAEFTWPWTAGWLLMTGVPAWVVNRLAHRRERAIDNPFRRCLQAVEDSR
ncbi:NACHT domain-containing protein [Streptomyces sp. NPDC048172]|uniref:NACHT domain-containing protein n=1 Tax=Streptomyces sp. NPDC048172 TaxID=3365505 RepID=UPI003724529E